MDTWLLFHLAYALGAAILGWLIGRTAKNKTNKEDLKAQEALKLLKAEYLTYGEKMAALDKNYVQLNENYLKLSEEAKKWKEKVK